MLVTTEEYTAKITACRLKGHIIATKWIYRLVSKASQSNSKLVPVPRKVDYLYCATCLVYKLGTESTGPK